VAIRRLPGGNGLGGAIDQPFLGYLAVRLLFQDEPVKGLKVQFFRADDSKVTPPRPPLKSADELTGDDGVFAIPYLVKVGTYRCRIEGQPDTLITTVEQPDKPFVVVLPVGRPYFDLFLREEPPGSLQPLVGQAPGGDQPQDVRGKGYLSVKLLFLDEPVSKLDVRFAQLDDGPAGPVPPAAIPTTEQGVASHPEAVAAGRYKLQIPGQPDSEIVTVEKPDEPFVVVLPIGRPYFDIHDP
jgi:hypothetical protein